MPSLQLRMLYGLAAIGIIYVTATSGLALNGRDLEMRAGRERSRCPFIRNSLMNGRVKIRSRGRIAKFNCNNGYELVGRRFATCVRGQWNNPIPICVTNSCPVISNPANGQINVQNNNALATFSCDSGYILRGSSTVYCNGIVWNDTMPICDIANTAPELTCDFEDSNICGWTHDRYHDFDWRRHQFSTPSGHVGTGPSYDHTLGKNNDGHYMYIEASSPRKENDIARLFSPVYFPESTPGCFVFWYHMYGVATVVRQTTVTNTTSSLRLFLKKESQVLKELPPVWEKTGQQGNLWLQGDLSIPELKENFQIVIEGIRGSTYVADTAIDDVALYATACEDLVLANISRGADSCQQRCHLDEEANSTCSCKQDCAEILTCCDDYQYFCTDFANRTDVGLFSIEPTPKPMSTPAEHSQLPSETFRAATIKIGQTLTSGFPTINATETTLSTSSKDSSNSTNQTDIMTKSSPLVAVTTAAVVPNGTISTTGSTTMNLTSVRTTTSLPSSIIGVKVNIFTNQLPLNTTESQTTTISPIKTIFNETTQNKQSITITQSAKTKQVITPIPGAKISTESSTNQPIKPTSPLSKTSTVEMMKPLSSKFTPSFNSFSGTKAFVSSTVILTKTTTKTTSPKATSTPASTTVQSTATKRVIPPIVITRTSPKTPMTSPPTVSTKSSTHLSYSTTSLHGGPSKRINSIKPTSKVSVETISSVTNELNSTNGFSKELTTGKPDRSTRIVSMRTQSRTFVHYQKTGTPNAKTSTAAASTSKSITPMIIPTTTSSILQTKTSFRYPSQSQHPIILDETSSLSEFMLAVSSTPSNRDLSTSAPWQSTSILCLWQKLKSPNKQCVPKGRNKYSSQVTVATTRAAETNLSQKNSTKYSQNSSLVTEANSIASEVITTRSIKSPLKDTPFKRNRQPSAVPSETITSTPNPITTTYQSTEMLDSWKANFKLRTKYRTYLPQTSKKSPISTTIIIVITLSSLSALVLIIIVALYVCCRKRKVAQSMLSDDSEMRFLSDSEIVEFMDASSKLHAEPTD